MTTLMMIFGLFALVMSVVLLKDNGTSEEKNSPLSSKNKNKWKPRYSPQKHVYNWDW